MIFFIGIDPGETIGLCAISPGGEVSLASLTTKEAACLWLARHAPGGTFAPGEHPLVALEIATHVHPDGERITAKKALAIAADLMKTTRLEGRLAEWCEGRGWKVIDVAATTWRKCLIGTAQSDDARIKDAFQRATGDRGRTNNHQRDAFWLARYAQQTHRLRQAGLKRLA